MVANENVAPPSSQGGVSFALSDGLLGDRSFACGVVRGCDRPFLAGKRDEPEHCASGQQVPVIISESVAPSGRPNTIGPKVAFFAAPALRGWRLFWFLLIVLVS